MRTSASSLRPRRLPIDRNDPDTLKDAFMNEVIENGGAYAARPCETCLYEISPTRHHAVGHPKWTPSTLDRRCQRGNYETLQVEEG